MLPRLFDDTDANIQMILTLIYKRINLLESIVKVTHTNHIIGSSQLFCPVLMHFSVRNWDFVYNIGNKIY